MIRELYYNIHDLLKVRLVDLKGKASDRFYRLRHFEVEESPKEPDITIEFGPFKRKAAKPYSVDHMYFVERDYIYVNDTGGAFGWETEIDNFGKDKVVVRVNAKKRNMAIPGSVWKDMFIFDLVLHPLIEISLLKKSILMLHSTSMGTGGTARTLCGTGGSFKTSIAMEFYRRGYDYMSDGFSILKGNSVYSYPVSPDIFEYRISETKDEHIGIADKMRILSMISGNKKTPTLRIKEKAELERISLIFKRRSGNLSDREIGGESFRKMLCSCEETETMDYPLWRYVRAYGYIFPDASLGNIYVKKRELIDSCVCNLKCSVLEVPDKWDPKYAEKIINLN